MNKEKIVSIIKEAFEDFAETEGLNININDNTSLMGSNSVIDSLGLVTLLVDVESRLADEDIEMSIISEKAMSQKNSPFINVNSLAEYIAEQIKQD
jgi:acyl carrier protein